MPPSTQAENVHKNDVERKSPASKQQQVAEQTLTWTASPQSVLQAAMRNPHSLTPGRVAQLQRAFGNQALGAAARFAQGQAPIHKPAAKQSPTTSTHSDVAQRQEQQAETEEEEPQQEFSPIQAKLTLGATDDPYEQEADRAALQVVQRLSDSSSIVSNSPIEAHSPLQRQANQPENRVDETVERSIQAKRGNGQRLSDDVRTPMEQAFGANFGDVHIHTDGEADRLNRKVQARAFTTGRDIFFRKGEYQPGSGAGKELIAHELTHVVQQGGGVKRKGQITEIPAEPDKEEVSQPSDDIESTDDQTLDIEQEQDESDTQLENDPNEESGELDFAEAEDESADASEEPEELAESEETSDSGSENDLDETTESQADETNVHSFHKGELNQDDAESTADDNSQSQAEQNSPKEIDFVYQSNPAEQQLSASNAQGSPEPDEDSTTSNIAPEEEESAFEVEDAESETIQAKAVHGMIPPVDGIIQQKPIDLATQVNANRTAASDLSESPPTLQRGLLSGAKDLASEGWDWTVARVVGPLKRIAAEGWEAIKGIGGKIKEVYQKVGPDFKDLLNPMNPLIRLLKENRRKLFDKALQSERKQRAQDATKNPDPNAPVNEPSQLERLDKLMSSFESDVDAVLGIQTEIAEGAILGDFKENPTIWNTIGQVAIGFVPYAGQAADVRDITAATMKLEKSGWKDGGAWFDLTLSLIAVVPGVGDAFKAVGKGAKGFLAKTLKGVLKNADKLLRPVLKLAKGMWSAAKKYGKRFLDWARKLGPTLVQGVKQFAKRATDFVKSVAQRAGKLISSLQKRVGQFIKGAVSRAKELLDRAKGFVQKAAGKFYDKIKPIFNEVQSRLNKAVDDVRALAQRGKEIAQQVGKRIADATHRAVELGREFVDSALTRGKSALGRAREWGIRQWETAKATGRRLVKSARQRVESLIRRGVKFAKEQVIPWIQGKLKGVKERIAKFLKEKLERLKEKFGGKSPEKIAEEAAKRQRKELLDELSKKGVKHNPDEVIHIARGPDGKIVFLEKGNSKAGLQHILEAHADDFARRGIPQEKISDLVMKAVTEGRIVSCQGKGRKSGGGRAIYEVVYGGEKHYVAVSVGTNGFIVGANPASAPVP